MRRTFVILLSLVLSVVVCAETASAKGRLIYRLALSPPAEVLKASKDTRMTFATLAKDRLEKRLVAAGVKEFEFRVASPSTLVIETGWNHTRAWMEALLTTPGRLEIRRTTPEKPDWLALARQLPEGIELRGDNPPHLWAAKRSTLQRFVKRLALPNVVVTVYPDSGGYRSVSLGDVVATQTQVKSASAQQSSTGAPFVAIEFEPAVGASLAAAHVSDVERVAVVLDGEVIAFVRSRVFFEQSMVRLSAPKGAVADDRKQRNLWARQVAGRLAASLPIPIAVLKE